MFENAGNNYGFSFPIPVAAVWKIIYSGGLNIHHERYGF